MKNINKSFALLCMGFAAVACVEENFEDNTPKYDTTPGNEIVFSATAGIENGMPEPETKTVYGDPGTDANGKKWIEINWDGDKDMIQIVSPEAAGPEVGHYRVGSNTPSEGFSQTHQSASVTKLGDGALQWSESDEYTFYGVYPSFAYDSDTKHGATATLTREGVFTGSMPIDQNYTLEGDETNGWVAKPDMRYAFMTASDTYKREPVNGETDNRSDAEKAINLEFKSMVTALQFDIVPSDISFPDEGIYDMEIVSLSLLSNKNITGGFEYDIASSSSQYTSTQGTRMASIHFDDDEKPLILKSKGKSLNVTFFILPETFDVEKETPDYLQLQIIFKLGATQMSRIATINAGKIKPGKKYIFNNVLLPPFTGEVPPSSWWDTLDPNTILPQISIPVAANVFANSNSEYLGSSIGPDLTQHTQTLEQLWAMGVRGFEIQTQSCTASGDTPDEATKKSLGEEGVVAAGKQMTTMTFGDAFDKLAGLLMTSKDASGLPTECLFVICTYSAYNDGYNPYTFVSNLFNFLNEYCDDNEHGITADNFERINNATTVGDLRGKIAIIIRPGDDERWLYETGKYQAGGWFQDYKPLTDPYEQLGIDSADNGLTALIPSKLSSPWWNRVMLIADWGAESYDIWDRRYGSSYARAATFNDKCVSAGRASQKNHMENYLFQMSTQGNNISSGTDEGYTWEETQLPTPLDEFIYSHSMSTGSIAYVQEWMRVIPESGVGPIAFGSSRYSRNPIQYETLWFNWPSSIGYKKRDIKNLFEKAILTRGKPLSDLYINVLSGYYADWNTSNLSVYPYKETFTGEHSSFSPSNPGKGGNFAAYAKDINDYVYTLLSSDIGSSAGLSQMGPWGLVMMDHIKPNDVSAKLVELIMMNNFKFDMTTTPSGGQGGEGTNPEGGSTGTASVKDYDSVYLDGQNAISFE